MTRILFHADPHGDFDPLRKHLEAYQRHSTVDAVILVGDQLLSRPLDDELPDANVPPIHWIHGNHDMHSDEQYDYLFGSRHPSLHGKVKVVGGLRIAGLGGIFAKKTWYPPADPEEESIKSFMENGSGRTNAWRGGLPRRRREHIWKDEYEALRQQDADVLVIHEAPECHPKGFKVLGDLARDMGVGLVVHGHHHYPYLAKIKGGIDVLGLAEAGSHVVQFP